MLHVMYKKNRRMIICTKPIECTYRIVNTKLFTVAILPNAQSINMIYSTRSAAPWVNRLAIVEYICIYTPHISNTYRHSSILRLNLVYTVH